MRCDKKEKVRFGTYMLHGSANNWWKSELHIHKGDPRRYTWEMFRTAFYAKYFPVSKLRQLGKQFLDLKQGSMSVKEYEAQFDQFSRFAPILVEDDESKAKKFEEGHNAHIRTGLDVLHLDSYDDVVGRAKSLDVVWRQTRKERNATSKKRNRESFSKSEQSNKRSTKSLASERPHQKDRSCG